MAVGYLRPSLMVSVNKWEGKLLLGEALLALVGPASQPLRDQHHVASASHLGSLASVPPVMLVSRTSALCSQHVFSRTFSTSTPALAIKARPPAVSLARQFEQLPFESFIPTQEESDYDTTAAGHMILHQQRQDLKYMRLIEHEMPKLVGEQACDVVADPPTDSYLTSVSQTIQGSNRYSPTCCPVNTLCGRAASCTPKTRCGCSRRASTFERQTCNSQAQTSCWSSVVTRGSGRLGT